MLNRNLAGGLLAAGLLSLVACGGGRGRPAEPGGAAVDADPRAAGLPALGDLPEPKESVALSAPGFHAVEVLNTVARANAVDGGGYLQLDNAAGVLTYALYGVYGFDGDNFPVSAMLNVGDASGQFYVAFSDYAAGHWTLTGPFNSDGEYGIPQLDGYTDPLAFVSPRRIHYFAVIVPPGSLVNLDGVALGVSGGEGAPAPVYDFGGEGGAAGLYLHWTHSASYLDPDFAGYIVQRAPQFGGAFESLAPVPAPATYFQDATAALDTLYRYRILSFDTSGNFATGPEKALGAVSGTEALPVAEVEMPAGPLYAPVDLTFFMQDSFDPEGEGITAYSANFYTAAGAQSLPGPSVSTTLQPGCYVISFEVECLDGRIGRTVRTLKVYPRWQGASALVRATEPTLSWKEARLLYHKGALQPGDQRLTLAGYDHTMPGLAFYHYDGAGGFESFRAPLIEWVYTIGEPAEEGDALLFPVVTPYKFYLAGFDGEQVTISAVATFTTNSSAALARDAAGKLWFAYGADAGFSSDITLRGVFAGGGSCVVANVVPHANHLDVLPDPATGRLLVFYEDAAGLRVADVDQVALLPLGSTPLAAGDVKRIDAEINPENNRAGVLYHIADRNYYLEQDGVGGWTAAALIDNSMNNNEQADLEPSADGRLNAYFSLANMQAYRYVYSGGVWTTENTASFSADSGYDTCLMPVPGSPDMRVADLCGDGVLRVARLNDDGTDNNFASLETAIGQGRDMHGAGGGDGLHLIWSRAHDYGATTHSISASGAGEGALWVDAPNLPATRGLNLVAATSGDVYASAYDGGAASLYWWDAVGGGFLGETWYPAQSAHRPLLSPVFPTANIRFGGWDDIGGTFHLITGAHGALGLDAPFLPDQVPVYDAVLDQHLTLGGLDIAAGAFPDKPLLGWIPPAAGAFDLFSPTTLGDEFSPYDKDGTHGRTLGGALAYSGLAFAEAVSSVCVVSLGGWVHPVRYTRPMFGAVEPFEYPLGAYDEAMDARVTVSVSLANSVTAVNLLARLDGGETYFEWSDFGRWERLELPPGLENLTQPLVVIGYDGRWHLVYRDWKTDAIMCRSTL